ncbi:MAG: hypothetical protein DHS20C09_13240 [marine bacterium B5-7]|nr:MAG: hypothetical protein DHS20C09_13240 [marine bacterium B5-7]
MSSKDILKGQRWATEIGDKLHTYQIGIVCVTPENQTAPWLLFESGALSKQLDKSRVYPLLLGLQPGEIDGPLGQFQSTVLDKEDFQRLLVSLNSLIGENRIPDNVLYQTFDSFWPKFADELETISEIKIIGTALNISSVTSVFGKYGFPEPKIGNLVYFSSGFESHHLYSSAFELAEKRIWIWGRKNRKVFDKEHKLFFEELLEKQKKGFDLKILFLDPSSNPKLLSKAHKDEDFENQLRNSINRARNLCNSQSIDFSSIAKVYEGLRNTCMVIVDDAILYSPVQYGKDGCVLPLTKSPFNIVGAESELGHDLEKSFLSCWGSANEIESN